MNLQKVALDVLHRSGLARLFRGYCEGVGLLLTLHHVRPRSSARGFSPNRILEISPEFLEAAINTLADLGYEFISLDEFHSRMVSARFGRKFASFTLDDGYADNYTYAYPIFRRYEIPFAIYLCTGIMDGTARLWWRELEQIVQESTLLVVEMEGRTTSLSTLNDVDKYRAFNKIYWQLRAMPHQAQLETMQKIRESNSWRPEAAAAEALSWSMVADMQVSGLLTIGAHTVNHFALSKLPRETLYEEIERGRMEIFARTKTLPVHFAYPYGDRLSAGDREFNAARELGFATAVTTRKGVIKPEQARQMHGIPRVSLNGDYQDPRYVRVLATGVPFAIFQSLNRQEATY